MDDDYARAVAHVFVAPLREGPDLPRQLHGQLGPGPAHGDLGPRGRAAHGRGHALLDRLPARVRLGLDHRRHGAPRDDAGRHRDRGEPGRRALHAADRRDARSCRSSAGGCRSSPTSTSTPSSAPARSRSRPATTRTTSRSAAATGSRRSRVIGEDGRMTDAAPRALPRAWTSTRRARPWSPSCARRGSCPAPSRYVHDVPHSHRSGRRIEPLISLQWFCDMNELAAPGDRGGARRPRALPPRAPVDRASTSTGSRTSGPGASRASSGGGTSCRSGTAARRPTWASSRRRATAGSATRTCSTPGSRPALWPFATLGWPEQTPELRRLLPDRRQLHGARHHLPLGRAHGDVRHRVHRTSCRSPT